MLEPGATIPKLKGTTADGSVIELAALRGHWVVVYFYPKDNTPACTTEAQEFRDQAAQFRQRNAVIIGVSRDSVQSHHNFTCKYELPFDLIADVDETWCKAFDVIHEKVLYGKRYLGIVRSTFLIDPKGRLAQAWRGLKVAGHVQAVLGSIPSA